ncbi:MAG: phosphoribosylformylglycinamidine synthase subunit PurL [Chloroflexi bacterium]|nr:phosphoribosylformylglycinamidine synthase subunit PurL [Chloroflexota bacterium]
MPVSDETLQEIALSRAEYEAVVERLGREPVPLELGLFGALWSEHCGYKHSKPLLRLLPSMSDRLLVAPGAENAGAVDIGDGLAIVMKIESHNHPSAVEPKQGAATGVGGIVRDIFAMGARPIALMNSLRFGPPDTPRNRYLLHGVVAGISSYGNCLGIPNVGGEVVFAREYDGNPLVNAMCVGLIEGGRIVRAAPRAPRDVILLVGADTGRDGIHGASGLASRAFEEQAEMRSAVQVGNPFLEKVLIEACLEAVRLPGVVGLQDLGAAGLTSAAIEAAARGRMGLRIDVAKVPRREAGMTPYEVMLSESQERMIVIVKPGLDREVIETFQKWDLDATPIGEFVPGDQVTVLDGKSTVVRSPVQVLTDPPMYEFDAPKPRWLADLQSEDLRALPLPSESSDQALLRMLSSPNIASKEAVYRQYDHQVQTNTVVGPGADAAVLRLKGTSRAIALSTDGNGRIVYADPFTGGAIAVAEACRNVSCTGATPIALTDGLNYGNPEKPDTQYQLRHSILGIRAACEALDVPVISGNVSLYNESAGRPVYPTPIIGCLGLLDDAERHCSTAFKSKGDIIVLLGADALSGDPSTLAASEFLSLFHGRVAGMPKIDLDLEARVQKACRDAIAGRLLRSAHDCSDGGLAVAVAESAIAGGIGANIPVEIPSRWDAALFGEQQSRVVVTVATEDFQRLEQIARPAGVPFIRLGTVGGSHINFGGICDVPLDLATNAWQFGFARATGG